MLLKQRLSQKRRVHWRRRSLGFTMLETIIIVVVIGILAMLAAPSLNSLFASIRVDQAVTELQTTFSGTQRAAIRNQESCVASLIVQNVEGGSIPPVQSGIVNNCQMSSDYSLPEGISVVSNVIPNPDKKSLIPAQSEDTSETKTFDWWEAAKDWACVNWGWCSPEGSEATNAEPKIVDVVYGTQGTVSYGIYSNLKVPNDTMGKFVVLVSSRPKGKQKCIAMSQRIGLTRVGTYQGGLSPADITDEGICTSKTWKKQ